MGTCCFSTASDSLRHQVPADRRRLSVAVDSPPGDDEYAAAIAAMDERLQAALDAQDITEMLVCSPGRRASIGTVCDHAKTSFAPKSVRQIGDELDPATSFLGYTCRKGQKPDILNQDSWFVLKVDDSFSIYAVFDGHGRKGHDVSNFVKDNLPKLVIKDYRFKTDDMPAMFIDSFTATQNLINAANNMKKLNAVMSGTTASVVIHDHTRNRLTIGHVGDSAVVIGSFTNDQRTELEARQLTRDHKPHHPDERERIEKCGGKLVFDGCSSHRIYAKGGRYPGLNMSRCIGDIVGHRDCGIIAEPEVSELDIQSNDHVLLICSDGVWEFISPSDAVKLVSEYDPSQGMMAADRLAKEAWERWIVEEGGSVIDDITVIIVFLTQQMLRKDSL